MMNRHVAFEQTLLNQILSYLPAEPSELPAEWTPVQYPGPQPTSVVPFTGPSNILGDMWSACAALHSLRSLTW